MGSSESSSDDSSSGYIPSNNSSSVSFNTFIGVPSNSTLEIIDQKINSGDSLKFVSTQDEYIQSKQEEEDDEDIQLVQEEEDEDFQSNQEEGDGEDIQLVQEEEDDEDVQLVQEEGDDEDIQLVQEEGKVQLFEEIQIENISFNYFPMIIGDVNRFPEKDDPFQIYKMNGIYCQVLMKKAIFDNYLGDLCLSFDQQLNISVDGYTVHSIQPKKN